MTASASEERDEPQQRSNFSRALLWRLLAVGLFVTLGTFAVVQSLNKESAPHAHDGHDHDGLVAAVDGVGAKTAELGELGGAVADKTKAGLNNAKSSVSNMASDALASITGDKNDSTVNPSTIAGLKKLAMVGLKPATRNTGMPVNRPRTLQPAKTTTGQFVTTRPPGTLGRSTVNTSFTPSAKTPAIVAAKPPTQSGFQANPASISQPPPERFAQLNGTPNTSGFNTGGVPKPLAQLPGKNLGSSLNSAAKNGLNSAAQKTNQLLNSAKQGANNMVNGVSNKASQFGSNLRAVEAKPPAALTQSNPFSSGQSSSRTGNTGFDNGGSNTNSRTGMQPISQAGPTGTTTPRNDSPFGSLGTTKTNPFAKKATPPPTKPAQQPPRNNLANPSPFRNSSASTPRSAGSNSATSATANAITSVAARNTPGDRTFEGVQAPALTIEKVSPREIQVNQTADFEIIVKNVGRVVADEVRVLDKVPAGTNFMGSSPEPASMTRNGDLQWSLGTLRPGQEKRLRYKLKPTQPGEMGSVAQVVFATRASMRTVVTKPVLEIRHSTNPVVMIGDNVVFDVVVENKGDGPANDVIIQEEVPVNLEFSDGSPEIEYEIGTLMPGQSRRVQLGLRAAKVGKLRNVMFASAKGGLRAQHELDIEVVAPDLKVTSDGPTLRFIQREATHRFTIQNDGTAKATNVELFARLPSGLRFVSANNRGKYDSNTHSVVWVMPELTQGVAGTVDLTTIPVEAGEQNIKFESFADLGLKSSTQQPLTVQHLIDVFFDIDDVIDPIEIGADTSYRIRVVNQGTQTATNVQLQVDFPPGLQPIEVDGNLRHQVQGQTVAFEPISTMRPGDELKMTVRASGKSQGDHRVVVNMKTDGRSTPVSKEETTRVYSDR